MLSIRLPISKKQCHVLGDLLSIGDKIMTVNDLNKGKAPIVDRLDIQRIKYHLNAKPDEWGEKNEKYWREAQTNADWQVRAMAVMQGHYNDALLDDSNERVCVEKVKQGVGLDYFISHESSSVREAIANKGYSLDFLIDDVSEKVRCAVARQGYGLLKLMNDASPLVRGVVAEQGYSLDILANDPNVDVVAKVADNLAKVSDDKMRHQIAQDLHDRYANNDEQGFEIMIALVANGFFLDEYITHDNSHFRCLVAQNNHRLDELINDSDWSVRDVVAELGYGLDKLIADSSPYVRATVARKGFGLDKLINDKDRMVRSAVVKYCEKNNLNIPK